MRLLEFAFEAPLNGRLEDKPLRGKPEVTGGEALSNAKETDPRPVMAADVWNGGRRRWVT